MKEEENTREQRTIEQIVASAARELEEQDDIKEFEDRQEVRRKAEDRRDFVKELQVRKNRKNVRTVI